MVELQHVPHVDAHFPQAPPTTHRENLAVGVVGGHCRQVHSPVACWRPGPVRVVGGWITSGGTSQL